MPDHCMHEPQWDITTHLVPYRICCWCDFTQNREYTGAPHHGPNFKGESRDFRWVPRSANALNNACPNRPLNS